MNTATNVQQKWIEQTHKKYHNNNNNNNVLLFQKLQQIVAGR